MEAPEKLPHYIYGRLQMDERVAKMLLDRDGVVASKDEDGKVMFTVYKLAHTRLEARELVGNLRAWQAEIGALANDLEHYIDCFDFSQPPSSGDQEECLP